MVVYVFVKSWSGRNVAFRPSSRLRAPGERGTYRRQPLDDGRKHHRVYQNKFHEAEKLTKYASNRIIVRLPTW